MKKESLFVSSVYDDIEGREPIEWANIWYSDAKNTPPRKREYYLSETVQHVWFEAPLKE